MQQMLRICLFSLIVFAITSPVAAHPQHDQVSLQIAHSSGFQTGFLHPLTGPDHLLAMIAIGILAVQVGGRALWLGPLSFLLGLAGGGIIGLAHLEFSSAETLIALSVVTLGLAIAIGRTPPQAILFIAIAACGILHGFAHGSEVPDASLAVGYVCGFLAGSVLLHAAGISFGLAMKNRPKLAWADPLRLSGGLITLCGLFLILQINA